MSNIETITDSGFNKPIAKLELSDKVNIVQAVALHKVILSSLGELTQFCEVAEAIQNHSELLQPFFCLDKGKDFTSGKSCR